MGRITQQESAWVADLLVYNLSVAVLLQRWQKRWRIQVAPLKGFMRYVLKTTNERQIQSLYKKMHRFVQFKMKSSILNEIMRM